MDITDTNFSCSYYEGFGKSLLKKYYLLCINTFLILLLSVFFCHLDETITAEGQIRPQMQEVTIKSLFSGNITEIFYKNTQFINKSDLLFVQNCSYEKDYLENQKKLEHIYSNYVLYYKQLGTLLDSVTIDCCEFDENLTKSNSVYSAFVNQYKNYQNELLAKQKYYERQTQLYPVIISKQELENAENDYIQQKFTFSNWIENQKIENLENLSTYSQKLEECKLGIFQISKTIEKAAIKANQSGYINEKVKLNIGDYLNEGTEILTIIPDNQNLKAVINVSNSNISKIKLGQEVLFQIKDLPYTKYGKLKGKITLIPSDAVVSDTVYFPVEVELDRNFLQDKNLFEKNEKIFLKVGTKVSAKIIVDKNTIFQKLLKKLVIYDN